MCVILKIKRSTYYKIIAVRHAISAVDKGYDENGISQEELDTK